MIIIGHQPNIVLPMHGFNLLIMEANMRVQKILRSHIPLEL